MTGEQITYLIQQMLYTALEISLPFLLVALLIGILVSLFQSFTHLQEMTLSFVPKILVVTLMLTWLFPWMLKILTKFTNHLLVYQWDSLLSLVHYVS